MLAKIKVYGALFLFVAAVLLALNGVLATVVFAMGTKFVMASITAVGAALCVVAGAVVYNWFTSDV